MTLFHATSLRTFFGDEAERLASGLSAFLPGDEFYEFDTERTYQSTGAAWVEKGGGGGGVPGGADTQIQFNDGGLFAGSPGMVWNKTLSRLKIGENVVSSTATLGVEGSIGLYPNPLSTNSTILSFANALSGNGAILRYYNEPLIVPPSFYIEVTGVPFRVIRNNWEYIRVDSSITVFNEDALPIDFRVEGQSDENLFFVDASSNRIGIGTNTPLAKVEARGSSETSFHAYTYNASQSSQFALFRARGTESVPTPPQNGDILGAFSFRGYDGSAFTGSKGFIAVHAGENWSGTGTGTEIRFSTTPNGSTALGTRVTIIQGMQVGSPTGGDKGAGTINVATNIFRNNTAYTNPDYALEYWATGKIEKFKDNASAGGYFRLSIEESKEYVKKNFRLPRISDEPAGIFDMADIALEKIEEAHTYIYELHARVKELEAKLAMVDKHNE